MIEYQERFSDEELGKIIEEGMIYMCACPAQVADAVRKVRELYRYQMNCLRDSGNDCVVHSTIAQAAIATHAQLEDCVETVLKIEKWDRTTLQMPADLRKRQAEEINKDLDAF
jgi:hypothetical protein